MGETSVRGDRLPNKRGPRASGVRREDERRKQLEQEIYDVKVKMEKATLHREDETKDFQVIIVDQGAKDFDESSLGAPFDDPAGDLVVFRQRLTLIDFINIDSILSAYKLMI